MLSHRRSYTHGSTLTAVPMATAGVTRVSGSQGGQQASGRLRLTVVIKKETLLKFRPGLDRLVLLHHRNILYQMKYVL